MRTGVSQTLDDIAVILAGGLGTRLRSVVSDRPKPMAFVNGRPFLDYLVQRLLSFGISEIVICVSYMRENIISYFQDKYPKTIKFSAEESPLGTGGALSRASSLLSKKVSFLVLNGDTYMPIDYEQLRAFHIQKRADATIVLAKSTDPQFAGVEVNSFSKITEFGGNSNSSGLVNAGVYWIDRKVFDQFPSEQQFSFEKDFLPTFVKRAKVYGYIVENMFVDIGTPESYLTLLENGDILKK